MPTISVSQVGADSFIKFFGDTAHEIPFKEHADSALSQFLLVLVYSSEETSREFFRTHAGDIRACYDSASAGSQSEFQEALASFDGSDDEGEKSWANEVRKICGIKILKPSSEK